MARPNKIVSNWNHPNNLRNQKYKIDHVNGTKECGECHKMLPIIGSFHRGGSYCHKCDSEMATQRYRRRVFNLIDGKFVECSCGFIFYKREGVCPKCNK